MTMDTFIKSIVKVAGKAILKRFGKDGVQYAKSEHAYDVVTKADLLSEGMIISAIRRKYPTHSILSEEEGEINAGSDYRWIIDPLDGTTNFASSVPMFGVMVCLAHKNVVKLSAIYLPITNELFFAKAGKGAYLNGKRIRCSATKTLDASSGCGFVGSRKRTLLFVKKLLSVIRGEKLFLNSFGCISMNSCYVACGRKDWAVSLYGETHDFAPTYLILKESGCVVTNCKGEQWNIGDNEAVAANRTLHWQLLRLTRGL
jgi:myo-inositol-1(or 4)-monophosphatase